MSQFLLVCRYGVESDDPDLGFVEQIYHGDRDVLWIKSQHPDAFVLPIEGDALQKLGRYGPEPQLIGDPPTDLAPSHAELDDAGIPHHVEDGDGNKIAHPLRAMAGKVYPDNRVLEEDHRPYLAPRDWPVDMLKAYAAQERWAKEVGGVTVEDVLYPTDRESQAAIEKLASRAARDDKFAPKLKAADGEFRDVGHDGLIKIADAVSDHVAACFAAEDDVLAAIAKSEITHRLEIDKVFSSL